MITSTVPDAAISDMQLEVALVDAAWTEAFPFELGMWPVEPPAVDPVDRTEQHVPRIRFDEFEYGVDVVGEEVDLEAEEHGESGGLGFRITST